MKIATVALTRFQFDEYYLSLYGLDKTGLPSVLLCCMHSCCRSTVPCLVALKTIQALRFDCYQQDFVVQLQLVR